MVDFVNHPPHYTAYKGLEIIELTEQMNFNRGNAVKYIARAGLKGESLEKEIEDLEKAVWYIQREIQRIAWATPEEEPTCDICCVMERDADAWCGNCGSCLAHCRKNEGCVSVEPTCDKCGKHSGIAVWCGTCGCCLEHCQHYWRMYGPKQEGFNSNITFEERDIPEFCPHYKHPSNRHLTDNCQRTQMRLSYDLEHFDTGSAHFIANRNVHLTLDEVIDEVRKMLDVGRKIGSFAVSTYEVPDEG